jgi:hypothetical protein
MPVLIVDRDGNVLPAHAIVFGRGYTVQDMGFGVVRWALGYLILGAMVVVPIWFLARLFGLLGRRDGT